MIYSSKNGDIDLTNLSRIYPAGVVELFGEVAEMSLEWCDMNEEKVTPKEFVLIFNFTTKEDEPTLRETVRFSTKDELFSAMYDVDALFK